MSCLGHLCARNKHSAGRGRASSELPVPGTFGLRAEEQGTHLVATPRPSLPGPGGMEALAAELGAVTAERAAAPVSAVEVRAAAEDRRRGEGRGARRGGSSAATGSPESAAGAWVLPRVGAARHVGLLRCSQSSFGVFLLV